MSGSRRLLIVGGIALAIWGMSYGCGTQCLPSIRPWTFGARGAKLCGGRGPKFRGLMLGKHCVPQPVTHSPDRQRNPSNNQQPPRSAHCRSADADPEPAAASNSPVYRKIPIHMASNAKITSKPPKSATPPATSPYFISNSTHTGSNSEPSKSTPPPALPGCS